ncbi:dienelactone hydrolase [Aquicoccus porphyridii]|uniref:Dienelactone hydrolase n=1 Tax=Aquicoccus porphyridii TaxID=1852029 RepID=A0A5A9ZW18_9RHOB|nr:dienelactone hydrolase [Aquicoccus porphyridii]KAA0920835.1 dienelactone hydrolase [Aquicoccus porphyridii]RAI56870.1 dienelactone hydrolase [Rhodobacteraceae bacterium AsT-22]
MNTLTTATLALALGAGSVMAENRIDTIRPDAPERAAIGDFPVGVQERSFTMPDRVDILNVTEDATPTYERPLTVEIWYPAAPGTEPGTTYETVIRDGQTPTTLHGRAARDAAPATGTFPLVVISHGYPGNRFLMSHLGENLASKGYVTVSVDHTDSTYSDQAAFGSTLLNRPWDQRAVIDFMAGLDDPIGDITDATTTGVIGYSMGGYGALIFGGAGVTQQAVDYTWGTPKGLLAANMAGTDSHESLIDERVKAIIAIGPWGKNRAFWDETGLAGLRKPTLIMAGSVDDVSSYPAMRQIFEQATGTDRHLLTFIGANHNAAAPIPAPAESYQPSPHLDFIPFSHYADAVWDTARMNNITQHFATAFMDLHLRNDTEAAQFLDLVEYAEDGVHALNDDGSPKPEHSHWAGFAPRTAAGLRFETRAKGE